MKILLASLLALKLSFCVLLFLICEREYSALKERGKLMICLKEVKGESHLFIERIEKLNWGIRNADRAKYLMALFPPLIPVAANAQKAKEVMSQMQNLLLLKYLMKLGQLKIRCRIHQETFSTPYQITAQGFRRNFEGVTQWRKKWKIKINSKQEQILVQVNPQTIRSLKPKVQYLYSISEVNQWSAFPFSWVSSSWSQASSSL